MQIKTVQCPSFSMDYFCFGCGKEPLVVLPGISALRVADAADAVAAAYRLLAEDFTVYVFERRNDMPPVYPVRDMARDTVSAIRALGLGPICLFGASQGGMMAMEIAIEHPELVRRLILGSTSARVSPEQYRLFEHWIRLAEDGQAEALFLSFAEALYPPAVFEQVREEMIVAAKAATQENLRRFAIQAEGLKGFDLTGNLHQIACPVLVIGDKEDRVLGGDASCQIAELLQGRTDCELFLYDGYGHAAYDLAPDYRERMLRFLVPERD